MSNAVASDPSLPSPSADVGAQVPCPRCGTFLSGVPVKVWERRVCESCATLLREEARLYPYAYIMALGILGNFGFAAILSAINWKRLGDRSRMRNAIIVAVLAGGWIAFLLAKDVSGGGLFINIIGSVMAAQGMKEAWEEHRKADGARANLVWPLVIGLGSFLGVVVAVAAGMELSGSAD
jgi:uncharacterized membrane protein YeaQ/YmgE (transglycosylase-associated protein family)